MHHAPEGILGRKKRPRQVSYIFGKVLMSTFWKVKFRNIWPSFFRLNCIFVLFWWIFTQTDFSLHTMVFFCGFWAIFWVLLGWGVSMGQFWYSTLFAFLHFFAFFAIFWHCFGFSGHLDILGVLVSYEVTRGIILVVGTVKNGLWGGLGGSRGVWRGLGGPRGGLLYPYRALFAPLEVEYGTRLGSKHYIMVQLASVYWVSITDPFLAY